MAYHAPLAGSAVLEDPQRAACRTVLTAVTSCFFLPAWRIASMMAAARRPVPATAGQASTSSSAKMPERVNAWTCCVAIFSLRPSIIRLLRAYLPPLLIVRGARGVPVHGQSAAGAQVSSLVALMRAETEKESLGGRAHVERVFFSAVYVDVATCEQAAEAPAGLLALAGSSAPRSQHLTAMFEEPATPGPCRSSLACAICRGRRSHVISGRTLAVPPRSSCWTSA